MFSKTSIAVTRWKINGFRKMKIHFTRETLAMHRWQKIPKKSIIHKQCFNVRNNHVFRYSAIKRVEFSQIFRGPEFSEFFHFVNHPKTFLKVATGTRSHTRLIRISEAATGVRLIRVSEGAAGYPIISGDDQNSTRRVPHPIRTSSTRIYQVPAHL